MDLKGCFERLSQHSFKTRSWEPQSFQRLSVLRAILRQYLEEVKDNSLPHWKHTAFQHRLGAEVRTRFRRWWRTTGDTHSQVTSTVTPHSANVATKPCLSFSSSPTLPLLRFTLQNPIWPHSVWAAGQLADVLQKLITDTLGFGTVACCTGLHLFTLVSPNFALF